MTDKTMTLEQAIPLVAGIIERHLKGVLVRDAWDAITRHLSQPAERGEAVERDDALEYAEEDAALEDAPPPAAGVPDKWPKLELWFFRELVSAQRLSLLELHGFPVDEIGESHVWQKNALRQLLSATPSPTIDVAAVRRVHELLEIEGEHELADKLARAIGDAK